MSRLDNCYNVYDLRDAAKRRLPKAVFEFVDRSTEDEIALRNNRAAFEKIRLKHRALVDVSGRSGVQPFVFIEANARLQVEHTVTEAVTGIDLVQTQIRLAQGRTLRELGLDRKGVAVPRGYAIQARVNMETIGADGSVRPTARHRHRERGQP